MDVYSEVFKGKVVLGQCSSASSVRNVAALNRLGADFNSTWAVEKKPNYFATFDEYEGDSLSDLYLSAASHVVNCQIEEMVSAPKIAIRDLLLYDSWTLIQTVSLLRFPFCYLEC